MTTPIRFRIRLAAVIAAVLVAAGAAAQDTRAEAERQREAASELARARAELEAAAREVARLAAQSTAPIFASGGRLAGLQTPRATLGLVLARDARVLNVTPNGPAAQAGIVSGDVIVAVDGTRLADADAATPSAALLEHLAELEPGTSVRLTVLRDGSEQSFDVTTRELTPFELLRRIRTGPGGGPNLDLDALRNLRLPQFEMLRAFGPWQSMQLVALTPDLGRYFGTEEGVLVVRAPERAELGLRDGDVILEIGERTPTSPEHASRILASFVPGETLDMTIMRDGRRQQIEIEVPAPAAR